LELAGRGQDRAEVRQDDDGADEGGVVGVDVRDADLGEDRGQRREGGRWERPELPRAERAGRHAVAWNVMTILRIVITFQPLV
jgi:hypothetical protein